MSTTTSPQDWQIGDTLPELVFGPVTRAQLALYAGASLDHNPIHIDSDFAKASGQADVFAHGMLGMAQFGRMLTQWAGVDRLERLTTRFTAIVPVGATLRISGVIAGRTPSENGFSMDIELEAVLEDGPRVLTGHARVNISDEPLPLNQEDR